MSDFPEIAGYRIEKELGEGGMATVYLGVQENLNRKVAIKVLDPILLKDKNFATRFLKEAETAANLNHPNIVTIYDVGQSDNYYFIIMEYLEENLKEMISSNSTIPPEESLDITKNIAVALHYAHKQGFVHKDSV